MSNKNNNNNRKDDVDLLKIVELRSQQGNSENCQGNDESEETLDDPDRSLSRPSPPLPRLATAAAPLLPIFTTTSGFLVSERTAAVGFETAGDLELVELTKKTNTTLQMSDNSHNRTTKFAQVPQQAILTRQT
ncbi:expressed unknown protein [Seminavis robusta]|uniref:Uncharacterized protein n=1 Tax=Seminavis robusta TaxID=568900 RepID=A0A9N8EVU9_9STRA|nr:expressed unknown protein [Seminavis robusta]|eukprot:Sro1839_g300870.1 n/a (133) ;mRNA; r:4195-4593